MTLVLMTLIACTDNQRTKAFGGVMTVSVPWQNVRPFNPQLDGESQ